MKKKLSKFTNKRSLSPLKEEIQTKEEREISIVSPDFTCLMVVLEDCDYEKTQRKRYRF